MEEPALARFDPRPESPDAGSAGVGDTTMTAPQSFTPPAPGGKVLAKDMPRGPLPGQIKPNPGGQCPNLMHAINGGCWMKLDASIEGCKAEYYVYKGGCYEPRYPPQRQPASTPQSPQ
jgi:eukaryotic-like serine/threonine-protein kinase